MSVLCAGVKAKPRPRKQAFHPSNAKTWIVAQARRSPKHRIIKIIICGTDAKHSSANTCPADGSP